MREIIIFLAFTLVACDKASKKSELSIKLVEKSISNMVAVKGGEFMMGDFSPLGDEHIPYSIQ